MTHATPVPMDDPPTVSAEPTLSTMDANEIRAALLNKPELETESVKVERRGVVVAEVEVRGLTRAEALGIAGKEYTVAVMEQKMLRLAMVNPRMSEEDIKNWQKVAPANELDKIVTKVNELSGTTVEAAKDAMKRFRE